MSTGGQSAAFHPIIHPFIVIRAEMLMTLFVGPVGARTARSHRISRVRPAENASAAAIVCKEMLLRGESADSGAGGGGHVRTCV